MEQMNNTSFHTFRIFISSSFKDMHAERDYLNAKIFPRLDSWLADRGWRLQAMDLRGSTAEASLATEEAVLRMCLSGVDYCRPYFLGLLGDRYGWIPEGAAAEDALQRISGEMDSLTAEELRGKSATHMEIHYALRQLPHEKCFFYSRQLEQLPDALKQEFFDGTERQAALRDAIQTNMGPVAAENYKVYSLHWENGRFNGLETLGEIVYRDLLAAFQKEIDDLGGSRLEESSGRSAFYFEQKASGSVPMPLCERLVDFALGPKKGENLLMLSGTEGSGKSTLAAQCHERLRQENCLLLPYVGGIGPDSYRLEDMVNHFISQLSAFVEKQGESFDFSSDPAFRYGLFDRLLRAAATQIRVVLLVDGLNSMEATDACRRFEWIDAGLPEEIRIVVVVPQTGFLMPYPHQKLVLPEHWDKVFLSRVMTAAGKKRGKGYEQSILTLAACKAMNEGSPLYACLLGDYLMSMTGADYNYSTSPNAHLEWMEAAINRMPETVEGAYIRMLERAGEALGMETVHSVLNLVAHSRGGIREVDLLKALVVMRESGDDPNEFGDGTDGEKATGLPDAASLLALRGLLREHLNPFSFSGYWRFEHEALERVLSGAGESENSSILGRFGRDRLFLHQVLTVVLQALPNQDLFKRHTFLWHCFQSRQTEPALEFIRGIAESNLQELLPDQILAMLREDWNAAGEWLVSLFEAIPRLGAKPTEFQPLFELVYGKLLSWMTKGELPTDQFSNIAERACESLIQMGVGQLSYGLETETYLSCLDCLLRADIMLKKTDALFRNARRMVEICMVLLRKKPEENILPLPYRRLANAYCYLAVSERKGKSENFETNMAQAVQAWEQGTVLEGKKTALAWTDLMGIYSIAADYLEKYDYSAAIEMFNKAMECAQSGLACVAERIRRQNGYDWEEMYQEFQPFYFPHARLAFLTARTGNSQYAASLYEETLRFRQSMFAHLPNTYERVLELADLQYDIGKAMVLAGEWQDACNYLEAALEQYANALGMENTLRNRTLYRQVMELLLYCRRIRGLAPGDVVQKLEDAEKAGLTDGRRENPIGVLASEQARLAIEWGQSGNYTGALLATGVELLLRSRLEALGTPLDGEDPVERLLAQEQEYTRAMANRINRFVDHSDDMKCFLEACIAEVAITHMALAHPDEEHATEVLDVIRRFAGGLPYKDNRFAQQPGLELNRMLGEELRWNDRYTEAMPFHYAALECAQAIMNRAPDLATLADQKRLGIKMALDLAGTEQQENALKWLDATAEELDESGGPIFCAILGEALSHLVILQFYDMEEARDDAETLLKTALRAVSCLEPEENVREAKDPILLQDVCLAGLIVALKLEREEDAMRLCERLERLTDRLSDWKSDDYCQGLRRRMARLKELLQGKRLERAEQLRKFGCELAEFVEEEG